MFKQSLIAAILALFLFSSGVFAFATPVPFLYLFMVSDRKTAWLSALIGFVVAASLWFFGRLDFFGVGYLGYFLLIAVLLGEGFVRRWGVFKTSSVALFVPWFLAVVAFLSGEFLVGESVLGFLRSYLAATMETVLKLQQASQTISMPQMAYIKEHISQIIDFSIGVGPAILLLFGLFIISLSIFLCGAITKRKGAFFGNVSQFPFWLVWVTISLGLGYFANAYFVQETYFKFVIFNGLIFCAGIYFLQGCLVIAHWLKGRKSPLLRLAVYGLIIIFLQIVGFFVIALGLSDNWLNFRRKTA